MITRISSIFFSIFFLASCIVSPAIAAGQITSDTTLVPVASVNIEDAKIVSQNGSSINLSFKITNRTGNQSGVKYGVQLLKKGDTKQIVADTHIYDDSLSLGEGSSIEKQITYTAPGTLSGTYTVVLTSQNESGFPFAYVPVGDVTLSGAAGIEIVADSCTVNGVIANKAVTVATGEKVALTCVGINHVNAKVSAVPSFVTTARSEYGEQVTVPMTDVAPIEFAAGEKKSFTVAVPTASVPQLYRAALTLVVSGVNSNSVAAMYTIKGATATIVNASLDKDYYGRGDLATIKVIWQKDGLVDTPTLTTEITNDHGRACNTLSTRELPKGSGAIVDSVIFINDSCFNPHLTLTLKSHDGSTVLDTKEFSFMTTSTSRPLLSLDSRVAVGLLALLVLGFVAFIVYRFIKHHKRTITPPVSGMMLFLLFLIGSAVFSTDTAYADTFVVRNNGYVYVTAQAATSFSPGDTIQVAGSVTSSSSDVANAYLSATANGSTQTLINSTPISQGQTISNTAYFTAGSPGSYTVSLTAGEDVVVPASPAPAYLEFDYEGYWDNSIGIHAYFHNMTTGESYDLVSGHHELGYSGGDTYTNIEVAPGNYMFDGYNTSACYWWTNQSSSQDAPGTWKTL